MKLVELLLGQDLIIQLILGGRILEFHSNVFGKDDTSVYVSPYLHNDSPLELNIVEDKGVICNIFTDDPNTKQRISWKNIELTTTLWKEKIAYCLKTHGFNNISNVDDRRLNDRVIIDGPGTVNDENSGESIEVVVHDISDIGISFYAPASFTPTSQQLLVSFSDTINGKSYFVRVDCSIARTKEDGDQVLIGCRITGDNKDYHIYRFMKHLASKSPKHSQTYEHNIAASQPEAEPMEELLEESAEELLEESTEESLEESIEDSTEESIE